MQDKGSQDEYNWHNASNCQNHAYLAPALLSMMADSSPRRSVLDIGSGNGSLTSVLGGSESTVVGLEASESGLAAARRAYPHIDFRHHDIDDGLPADLMGRFDVVVSAEVIEHLFFPRSLFSRAREALHADGSLLVSTPYHGYLKNLALAVSNSFDHHWRPGWDYGHIKFFSVRSLTDLAAECGFRVKRVSRVGRVPVLAKTMVVEMKMK